MKINKKKYLSFKSIYFKNILYFYILILLFSYTIEYDCSDELPFFNKLYNYCTDYCSYNNLLSGMCFPISEYYTSTEKTFKIIEDLLKNSTIQIKKYEYIINGDNITFQITNTKLLQENLNMNNTFSNSYINLTSCENKIKEKNSIDINNYLIIILINKINTSYITNYDKGFFVYDPINITKLNILDACNSVEDIIYFNVSVSLRENINKLNYSLFNKNGFNIANKNDPFYTDVCKNYTGDYDSDMPLSYRKKEFKDYILDICGENCIMVDFDFMNAKVFCKCYTSYENKIKGVGKRKNIFDNAKLNFNVLQCYKNILKIDFKKIYTKIIFLLLSFLLLLFLILMLIYFIRKNKSFNEIIENIMDNNRAILKRINVLEWKSSNKNNYINEEEENDIIQKNQTSNYYLSRNDPSNLVSRGLKDSSRKYLFIQNENNLNEKINKLNNLTQNEKNKKLEFNYATKKANIYNTRVIYESKIINETPEEPNTIHKKHIKKNNYFNKEENIGIKIDNNFNDNYNNKNKYIEENNQPISKYNEYNIIKKIIEIPKEQRLYYYCDTEMNLFEYEKYLEIDTRSLLRYYWSIISDNDILLYSFGLWNNDYNFITVKLSFFIFSFFFILLINICFMSDKDIYHLFEAQGKYTLTYYLLKNTFSMLICFVIILLMKYLVFSINQIFIIRSFEKDEFQEKVQNLIKSIHKKNTIFFVISLVFNLFIWYFVMCFCNVYINNEIVLISNALVTFAEISMCPFLFGIFAVIFRYNAIKSKEEKRIKLYKFNQYYEFFLL